MKDEKLYKIIEAALSDRNQVLHKNWETDESSVD